MKRAARLTETAYGPTGQSARPITASENVLIGVRAAGPGGTTPGVLFHLHVDGDRDGQVDADWRSNDRWDWDRRGVGAIVLPYLNTDKPRRAEDIAPLTIRRDPSTAGQPVAGWRGELSADNPYKLTLLSGRTAAATPLSDPLRSPVVGLDLSQDEIELGMEATQHPGPYLGKGRDPDPNARNPAWVFDGLVRLRLDLYDPSGQLAHSETALVRVAPWIAFNHFDPTEAVYVSDYPLSQDIRDKLAQISPPVPVRVVPSPQDQWTQDQGEPGFTAAPNGPGTTLDKATLMELKTHELHDFVRPNMTVLETLGDEAEAIDQVLWRKTSPGATIDYGGNLECVPPFVHSSTKRVYSYGRLYYGTTYPYPRAPSHHRPFYGPLRRFLEGQSIQEPFVIDTGWLSVGHVDEVVCVMPMKDARLGFRVLIASHQLALGLLAGIPGDTPVFGPHTSNFDTLDPILSHYARIQALSKRPPPSAAPASQPPPLAAITTAVLKGETAYNVGRYDFVGNAAEVSLKLASVRSDFAREVGLEPGDFIELPVLFALNPPAPPAPGAAAPKPRSLNALAFTPDVVNGLVITRGAPEWSAGRTVTFVAPKPYGPVRHANGRAPTPPNDCVFEEHIRDALGPTSKTGVDVVFADDFVGYHLLHGEVHCGTNSLRTPSRDRRWWAPREDTRR